MSNTPVKRESILSSRRLPTFPLLWLGKMTWASAMLTRVEVDSPVEITEDITRGTGIVETVNGSCDKNLNWSRIVWVYQPQGTKVTAHEPVTERSKTRD